MEYQFADRVLALKPSVIREILKNSSDPAMIPLSAGNPAPEAFPVEAIREISARLLSENPTGVLQYNLTEGCTPLREAVRARLAGQGLCTESDGVLITSGAQQVMDLAAKSLCNEGDTVLCEAPSFIGSLNTFRSYRAHLRGVPVQKDGMDMNALEAALREEKNVRFIYVIPNFQNPSGVTMSAEKRKRLYELAKKYNTLILEDDPYGALRFEGQDIPAVKSLDKDGRVIYAGTFSKTISPGMRVGYALAPEPLLKKMVVCKQGEDVHSNVWAQMLCHALLTQYDFDAHLEKMRGIYRRKAVLAQNAMERFLKPCGISWNPVQGGLFLWCTLPQDIDMPEFCAAALLRKVCVVPGNAFLTDEAAPCQSFRVNFSTPTDEQLVKGIELLGQVL